MNSNNVTNTLTVGDFSTVTLADTSDKSTFANKFTSNTVTCTGYYYDYNERISELKKENEELKRQLEVQKNVSKTISCSFADYVKENADLGVAHISFCDTPGKEKVIVIFKDGTKVIKAPVGEDIFDINVGVALAIAEHYFGSKSQYHKFITRSIKQKKKVKNSK